MFLGNVGWLSLDYSNYVPECGALDSNGYENLKYKITAVTKKFLTEFSYKQFLKFIANSLGSGTRQSHVFFFLHQVVFLRKEHLKMIFEWQCLKVENGVGFLRR
jgi:hypothetical protein